MIIPLNKYYAQHATDELVVRTRLGNERVIKAGSWWIDINTPVGEPADYYEWKPWNGRKFIPRHTIIGIKKVAV